MLCIDLGNLWRPGQSTDGRHRAIVSDLKLWRHEAGIGRSYLRRAGALFETRLDFPLSERGWRARDARGDLRFHSKAQPESEGVGSAWRRQPEETISACDRTP